MMKKRLFAMALSLFLALTLAPTPALAVGVEITVTANIAGADIYIGEAFSGKVTPASVEADNVEDIAVVLPGYTAEYVRNGNTVTAILTPELYPADYAGDVIQRTVGYESGQYTTLGAALGDAKNNNSSKWYLIEFADGYPVDNSGVLTIDDSYLNLTINGGGGVTLSAATSLRIYGSDIRVIGLNFEKRTSNDLALQMRVPDNNDSKPYYMNNIYVLGCSFDTAFEVGVATCGERGYAGTEYDGDGTANFNNLVFAGNTFDNAKHFSFAGAGDEDYNVINGYKVCGNRFIDAGIGILAGDAHTWYVYGYDGEEQPAYCENNILQNVLISGNSFTMTEDALESFRDIIGIGSANLGNSNNLLENVEIRNNTSRITGGTENMFSSISVNNVSVSDGYSGKSYDSHIFPGMEDTDNNVTTNVRVHDNDFQVGTGRPVCIGNIDVGVGAQCGKNNTIHDIRVYDNTISSETGVRISNYKSKPLSGECSGNAMYNIIFTRNTVERGRNVNNDDNNGAGITVTGSLIGEHGQPAVDYPEYAGTMSDVTVSGNTVTGYKYGVVVAGAAGDYGVGMGVSDVTVSGNTISTALYNPYPEHDFGVVVAGTCLQTHGRDGEQGSPLQPSNTSCFARNVSVTDNTITAQGGVVVTGNLVSSAGAGSPTDNYVSGVTITGNTLTRRVPDSNPVTIPAILVTSAVDPWGKMNDAGERVNAASYFDGCFTEDVTVGGNIKYDYEVDDIVLYDNAPVPQGWINVGGLYRCNLRELYHADISIDKAYYLPMPANRSHITVKRTGLEGCATAVAALYGGSGKMLGLAMGTGWVNNVLTLTFSRDNAATVGKVFFLTSDHAPACPAAIFIP